MTQQEYDFEMNNLQKRIQEIDFKAFMDYNLVPALYNIRKLLEIEKKMLIDKFNGRSTN
jgi:hypothetical protein